MKNFFRFAAIAATMLTLCVACKKAGDQGTKEPLSIDGKQWCFEWGAMGTPVDAVLDLGVSQKDMAIVAVDAAAMNLSVEGYVPYYTASYTVTATSAKEGKISLVDPSDPSGSELVITYKDLTEKTVKVSNEIPFMLDNVTLTLAEEKAEIVFPEM